MRRTAAALDEEAAWALVRAALAAGHASRTGWSVRAVQHPDRPDLRIELDGTSRWSTTASVTDAGRDLLDLFLPLALREDLVIGQLGQSLDGRIATESGHSHYVTGPADIKRLHRLRALVDAVVVGAGTVAQDDPRLTVREVEGENPVRVVLDPDYRLSVERRVFSDGAARTLVFRRAGTADRTHGVGTEAIALPAAGTDGFEPAAILEALRARGLRRVLVEGGGVTVSRFLQAGLLDRLHVTVAPLLIGSGRPALTLPPVQSLDQALRPRCRHFALGHDLLFDLELR